MEEDIMILESECYYLEELGYLSENNHFIRFNQALENLIKGYKKLEKDLHEMTISNNHKKENWVHKNCLNEYIPKSKIKEKIEELKETADEDNQDDYIKIQVLKELAEAFEKHIPNIE